MCLSSSDKLSNSSRDDMAATRPKETEMMKIERERELGSEEALLVRRGAQQRKQQTQRRNQTTTRDDADCAALDKDYFRAENELPVENKQKMVVGSNFLLIDF